MDTARALTDNLVNLLDRENDARAEFLVALAAFDHDRVWVELGYPSLFDFLHRELRLSRPPPTPSPILTRARLRRRSSRPASTSSSRRPGSGEGW